jgi:hypothetical protein
MNSRVVPDQELWREAFDILLNNLSPSKAARVIARLGIGGGDYLLLKEKLFASETVKSLSAKIVKFQAARKRAVRRRGASRRPRPRALARPKGPR